MKLPPPATYINTIIYVYACQENNRTANRATNILAEGGTYGHEAALGQVIVLAYIICMNECVHACMHACTHGCMDAGMHGCMDAWVHGCMNAWMHGCMDEWMPWMPWMNGCMGAWVHGCMDAWMYKCINA